MKPPAVMACMAVVCALAVPPLAGAEAVPAELLNGDMLTDEGRGFSAVCPFGAAGWHLGPGSKETGASYICVDSARSRSLMVRALPGRVAASEVDSERVLDGIANALTERGTTVVSRYARPTTKPVDGGSLAIQLTIDVAGQRQYFHGWVITAGYMFLVGEVSTARERSPELEQLAGSFQLSEARLAEMRAPRIPPFFFYLAIIAVFGAGGVLLTRALHRPLNGFLAGSMIVIIIAGIQVVTIAQAGGEPAAMGESVGRLLFNAGAPVLIAWWLGRRFGNKA